MQLIGTHTASIPFAWVQVWFAPQLLFATSCAHVTGARHSDVGMSHTVVPAHILFASHGQPGTSLLHIRHTFMPSQYSVPSHFGAAPRHGHAAVPSVHVLATHTLLLQTRPAPHMSPAPHAQPISPGGHDSHSPPVVHRSPALHVLFDRQMHALSPRLQSVHLLARHSPVVHAPPTHAQPMVPAHPPPPSLSGPASMFIGPPGHAVSSNSPTAVGSLRFIRRR